MMIITRDRLTLASQRVADHHLADRLRDASFFVENIIRIIVIVVVVTGTRPAGDLSWPASWIGTGNLVHQHHQKLCSWTLDMGLGHLSPIFMVHCHDLALSRNQTNLLLKTRAQLEHAMKETEHPLRVNSENIYTRFVMILMQMLVMN